MIKNDKNLDFLTGLEEELNKDSSEDKFQEDDILFGKKENSDNSVADRLKQFSQENLEINKKIDIEAKVKVEIKSDNDDGPSEEELELQTLKKLSGFSNEKTETYSSDIDDSNNENTDIPVPTILVIKKDNIESADKNKGNKNNEVNPKENNFRISESGDYTGNTETDISLSDDDKTNLVIGKITNGGLAVGEELDPVLVEMYKIVAKRKKQKLMIFVNILVGILILGFFISIYFISRSYGGFKPMFASITGQIQEKEISNIQNNSNLGNNEDFNNIIDSINNDNDGNIDNTIGINNLNNGEYYKKLNEELIILKTQNNNLISELSGLKYNTGINDQELIIQLSGTIKELKQENNGLKQQLSGLNQSGANISGINITTDLEFFQNLLYKDLGILNNYSGDKSNISNYIIELKLLILKFNNNEIDYINFRNNYYENLSKIINYIKIE